ncbi:hypothetical protein HC725_16400 [Vibrio sp. S17_S38]|uniref:hypothetical protein n=1 Tax=Vibrio sp. S17_S38 TaxID=2720229 RepID=UPI00168094A3|nr:hypothetical protein [Vibrio sp. S17_S38]MBD1574830.1 hypothetical protein [Vibrio sp. S17_S38]
MDKSIESTKWIEAEKIEFKSQVYSSIDEYFKDVDRAGRDEDYTNIKGTLWPRSQDERNRILIDKIKAKHRLESHSDSQGTELMLSI